MVRFDCTINQKKKKPKLRILQQSSSEPHRNGFAFSCSKKPVNGLDDTVQELGDFSCTAHSQSKLYRCKI
jgi:hypothetical protein